MNKDNKIEQLELEVGTLKQFIQLLNGPDALKRIEKEIDIQRTNKVLTIHDPSEFDNYINALIDR